MRMQKSAAATNAPNPQPIYSIVLIKFTGFSSGRQNSTYCFVIHGCGDLNVNKPVPIFRPVKLVRLHYRSHRWRSRPTNHTHDFQTGYTVSGRGRLRRTGRGIVPSSVIQKLQRYIGQGCVSSSLQGNRNLLQLRLDAHQTWTAVRRPRTVAASL